MARDGERGLIALFTDFGVTGPYVGQMHGVIAAVDPTLRVIDLMHDAPQFDPGASSHLLAALADHLPPGTVTVGVIDPGVGTDRRPLVLRADGRWFVGPDNGLFDVIAARAGETRRWRITRPPDTGAATFHGRDLFAPVGASIARGDPVPGEPVEAAVPRGAGAERSRVVYIDAFGNAMTGLRAAGRATGDVVVAGGRRIAGGRMFADVEPGTVLWFTDSIGLVEIAVNQGSAAATLGLEVGAAATWHEP